MKVLYEYISLRISRNVQILQVQGNDEVSQTKRLVTSAAIVCLAVNHGMTFLRDDEVANLLECLMLNVDPAQKKCSGFDAILRHFPKKEHKR